MTRLVIVGGSAAGISAGLRARVMKQSVEPLLVVDDEYPNFSICVAEKAPLCGGQGVRPGSHPHRTA